MCTIHCQGFEYRIIFRYENLNNRKDPITICSAKNLATGEILETKVSCYTKTDSFRKWLGRRLAFGKLISKLTNDKNERKELWKEFFSVIKSDPYRDNFFNQYVEDYMLA